MGKKIFEQRQIGIDVFTFSRPIDIGARYWYQVQFSKKISVVHLSPSFVRRMKKSCDNINGKDRLDGCTIYCQNVKTGGARWLYNFDISGYGTLVTKIDKPVYKMTGIGWKYDDEKTEDASYINCAAISVEGKSALTP